MPKYVLNTKGKIVERGDPNSEKDATELAGEYTGKAGSYHEDKIGVFSNVNLPFTTFATSFTDLSNDEKKHIIGSVTPTFTTLPDGEKDIFPERKDNNFLINPSFGADEPVKFHKNFNDYLNTKGDPVSSQNSIFADELEMIAGLEFNSLGFFDLSRILFVFDYIFEAIAYIAVIEGILLAEKNIIGSDGKTTNDVMEDYQMELGNYGPVSYNVLSRFMYDVLQYPKDKRSTGIDERIGAFIVGLSLYVNSDPKFFMKKFGSESSKKETKEKMQLASGIKYLPIISEIAYYFIESISTLSKIGQNRLFMLIRRFHQKADWHKNVLYKAKENSPENFVDKFIVELNYYYVKFIIERMNVGLKLKNYYKHLDGNTKKFNRSARLKDSSNGLRVLKYNRLNKTLAIESFRNPSTSTYKIMTSSDETNNLYTFQRENWASNKNESRQSMSNSALPQAFILPDSFIRSMGVKESTTESVQLFSKAFAEEHVSSYFINTSKSQERLSPQVVAELEAFYEKEMMPFYFQDLRTNEIIGFHAFIDSIIDNFNPNYNPTKGFGRIDAVQHYVDTTRNVNVTFTLAAMSKEDHDLMWYQINKIVSMCYPQWSDGFKKKTKDGKDVFDDVFGKVFPFTQVPTASPLIRMRLGDVIKSNYTKHAIEKLHGSGNKDIYTLNDVPSEPQKLDTIYVDKKVTEHYILPGEYKRVDSNTFHHVKELLYLGKPGEYTISKNDSKSATITIRSPLDLIEKNFRSEIIYEYIEIEVDSKSIVEYIKPDYNYIAYDDGSFKRYSSHIKAFKDYTKAYDDDGNVNNPVTAAYETTLGKGLAGFITMLDVNYNDQLWETEVVGSKAPKLVKLTINFAPIHDIPPGLDADGSMRAPVYNTGRIINTMYGDVYDKDEVKNRN